jgi:hypothetical protein
MFLNKPTKDILLATFMIKFSSTLFCLIPWGDVFKVFESFYLTNAAIVFSHITNWIFWTTSTTKYNFSRPTQIDFYNNWYDILSIVWMI